MRFIRNTGFIHNYVHTYHLNFNCVLFAIKEACILNILIFNDCLPNNYLVGLVAILKLGQSMGQDQIVWGALPKI